MTTGTSESRESPVFICGLGRSGTTLLRNLLDGHPELFVLPGETWYYRLATWSRPTGRRLMYVWELFAPTTASLAFARPPCTWLLGNAKTDWARTLKTWYFNWAKEAALPEPEVDELIAGAKGPRAFWECAVDLTRAAVPNLGPARAWVEKTPLSERFTGMIERDFSGRARYIHMVRDPRAVCASRVRDPSRRATPRSTLLTDACYDWSLSARLAAHHAREAQGRHLVVRYEDLIEKPRDVMTAVAEFLRIAFDEALLRPTLFGEPTVIYSSYESIRPAKGIESASMDRVWTELTPGEVSTVQGLLGRQMTAWGYSLRHVDASPEPWARTGPRFWAARRWAMARWQTIPAPPFASGT